MMRHVRFPLMTVADLASHVEPSGILDEQQCLDLFTWKGKAAVSSFVESMN
jgi:hypothetical protein